MPSIAIVSTLGGVAPRWFVSEPQVDGCQTPRCQKKGLCSSLHEARRDRKGRCRLAACNPVFKHRHFFIGQQSFVRNDDRLFGRSTRLTCARNRMKTVSHLCVDGSPIITAGEGGTEGWVWRPRTRRRSLAELELAEGRRGRQLAPTVPARYGGRSMPRTRGSMATRHSCRKVGSRTVKVDPFPSP